MPVVEFGEWLPDQPTLGQGKALSASNVIPVPGGYGPLPDLAIVTNALTARAQGALTFKGSTGATISFAGDATKLYKITNVTWGDVSGATYATPDYNQWSFARFGDNILAGNGVERLQRFNLKSSTAFADVVTGPFAKHLGVVRDFVVAWEEGADFPLKWSARNDSESWEPTVNFAGEQAFPEGGRGMGIVGGEVGTIFQEGAITRMTFIGGDPIFQFDQLEGAQGCLSGGSIVTAKGLTYYLSRKGFMVFDGVQSVPIGHGKVDETFFAEVNFPYLYRMSAGIDPIAKVVAFAYPTTASADGTPDKILFYSLEEQKWSESTKSVELLFSDLGESTDLDSITESVETVTPSLDSDFYMGGLPSLSAFDAAHKLNRFTGSSLAGVLETGEFTIAPEDRSRMRECTGLVDGAYTVTVKHRNRLTDAVTADSAITPQTSGRVPVRVNDRYFSAQMNIIAAETWTQARGFDVRALQGGR